MLSKRKPGKTTVALHGEARPSRIRRDPVPADKPLSLVGKGQWNSREWEIGLALAGIIFFALAITALVFDIAVFLGG